MTESDPISDKDRKINPEKKPDETKAKPRKEKEVVEEQKAKGWIGHLFVESILLNSKPMFLFFDTKSKKIGIVDRIETGVIVYVPLEKENYGYDPYIFSGTELDELLASNLTKEGLLSEIAEIVEIYLDARDEIKNLVIGDLFLSYCQEWIRTIHFIFAVGETESGKSTLVYLFKLLAYRCLYGTNIPAADVYNFLGTSEEGAGTIAEDEAQDISFDRKKIRLYKNSYAKGARQPIIDMKSGRRQIFYWTFCLKIFAGERLPYDKGMIERLAICFMKQGKPKRNAKRLTAEEQQVFSKLRNKILVWKLENLENGLGTIQSGLEARDQELYEDFLRVMSGTKYEQDSKKTVQYFVKQRHERIWNSLEAKICRLVMKMINENNEVYFLELWGKLFQGSEISIGVHKSSFEDLETGQKISANSLAKMLEEKFQGKKMVRKAFFEENGVPKQKRITYYVFDKKTLSELATKYNIEPDSDEKN